MGTGGGGGGGGRRARETELLYNSRTLRTMLCTKLISTVHCYHRSHRCTSTYHLITLSEYRTGI